MKIDLSYNEIELLYNLVGDHVDNLCDKRLSCDDSGVCRALEYLIDRYELIKSELFEKLGCE